jgi:hypothetical protein
MAALSKNRRKKGGQPTPQDLVLALSKAVGLDLTQEYDAESFSQLWVDLYQSEDPESYAAQGQYVYNLFVQLQDVLTTQQDTTAIVPVERKTKVWYQHTLELVDKTDGELVDDLLSTYSVVVKPIRTEGEDLAFVAVEVGFDD